jgi:hypothetical protein
MARTLGFRQERISFIYLALGTYFASSWIKDFQGEVGHGFIFVCQMQKNLGD